jgi:hypothetical protein
LIAKVGDEYRILRQAVEFEVTAQDCNTFSIIAPMKGPADLAIVWRCFELVAALEHSDPISLSLWDKRWTISASSGKGGSAGLSAMLAGIRFSKSAFFYDDLVEQFGYERPWLDANFPPRDFSISPIDEDIEKFCRNRVLVAPDVISMLDVARGNFPHEHLIARAKVAPNGYTHRLNIPWTELGESRKEFENRMHLDPLFRTSFARTVAETVSSVFGDVGVELTQSELLGRFCIEIAQLTVSNSVGAMIEMMKRVFACRPSVICHQPLVKALLQMRWDSSRVEAFVFLRYLSYIVPDLATGKKFFRRLSIVPAVVKGPSFSEELLACRESLRLSASSPSFNFFPHATFGSLAFILTAGSVKCLHSPPDFSKVCMRPRFFTLPDLPQASAMIPLSDNQPCESGSVSETIKDFTQSLFFAAALSEPKDLALALFVAGLIAHSGRDGLSLSELLRLVTDKTDAVLNILVDLENVAIIRRRHSSTAVPYFVSSLFCDSRVHHWTSMDGGVDIGLWDSAMRMVFESIEFRPGIEILELVRSVPTLCLYDLLAVLQCLELDEMVYRVTVGLPDDSGDLFSDGDQVVVPNLSDYRIGLDIAASLKHPGYNRIQTRLFPTGRLPLFGGTSCQEIFEVAEFSGHCYGR